MRSITRNDKKQIIFINLHLEEVFHNLFTYNTDLSSTNEGNYQYFVNDDKGIYQRTLTQGTIKYLINQMPKVDHYTFALKMDYIEEFGENAVIEFKKLIRKIVECNRLTIFGISNNIYSELEGYCNENFLSETEKRKITLHESMPNECLLEEEEYKDTWERIFQERVCQEDCRELYNGISHSSSVKLKYYFNVKPLFTDPLFLCNSIYDLAIKLKDEINIQYSKNNRNICLLAMSMNGMTICSLLAQLFEVDIIRIDHLGPYNELYLSSFERFVNPKKDYYIVSDVICMGREVSDAKAVLKMFGANCKGVISLISITPVYKEDVKTYSVININKNNNDIYEYGINTDLNYND